MVNLKYFDASEFDRNVKCTIHKSGKIGFSSTAIKRMKLDEMYGIKIARDEDESGNDILYMICTKDKDNSAFKLIKAGEYYYINAKLLLEQLKMDYLNPSITFIYDIVNFEIEGEVIYKLIKREVKKGK